MIEIDNSNYELWLARYAEGELDAAQCAAVESYIREHPEAAEELSLYRSAPRLEADESVVFDGAVPGRSLRLRPVWLRRAAAAAIAAVLLLPLLLHQPRKPQAVASHRQPTQIAPSPTPDLQAEPKQPQTTAPQVVAQTQRPSPQVAPQPQVADAYVPAQPCMEAVENVAVTNTHFVPPLVAEEPEAMPAEEANLIVFLSDNDQAESDARPRRDGMLYHLVASSKIFLAFEKLTQNII